MHLPVLVEPVANNGYQAKFAVLDLLGEGATPEQALRALEIHLQRRLNQGARLTSLQVPAADNPWLAMAGMHDPNDPLVQDWEKSMADYRRQVEEDPNYP